MRGRGEDTGQQQQRSLNAWRTLKGLHSEDSVCRSRIEWVSTGQGTGNGCQTVASSKEKEEAN